MDFLEIKTKERSANFTPDECQHLTHLIDSYKDTILCTKTDSASWFRKEQAWGKIEKQFNIDGIAKVYRNAKQLKNKFENMKKAWRKSGDQAIGMDSVTQLEKSSSSDNDDVASPSFEDILTLAHNTNNTTTNTTDDQPISRKRSLLEDDDTADSQLQLLKIRHAEELHKQELRHREEEHSLKMVNLEAKSLQDEQEHLMRMEEYRLKIKALKRQCEQN